MSTSSGEEYSPCEVLAQFLTVLVLICFSVCSRLSYAPAILCGEAIGVRCRARSGDVQPAKAAGTSTLNKRSSDKHSPLQNVAFLIVNFYAHSNGCSVRAKSNLRTRSVLSTRANEDCTRMCATTNREIHCTIYFEGTCRYRMKIWSQVSETAAAASHVEKPDSLSSQCVVVTHIYKS